MDGLTTMVVVPFPLPQGEKLKQAESQSHVRYKAKQGRYHV